MKFNNLLHQYYKNVIVLFRLFGKREEWLGILYNLSIMTYNIICLYPNDSKIRLDSEYRYIHHVNHYSVKQLNIQYSINKLL
jgi:hypothetical protein